ncbi:APC family permease [Granulicella arctica]|uniref:Amino acid transporter n=1 Tax=Granulicella arctica TaxID=940613 RepID=A0A7Y9PJZ2_9BACT|nr:APC family permease [Granulicella arctica]NYF80556.1 amino acid transporter [Granulicella arctica]
MSETNPDGLARTLNLRGAVALNMLDMIGVGPFITLPLILGAMGGPQAMLGWIFGALLALCDGLVWAELGAAMPQAGGSYEFLRRIYPGQTGRFLAFLFLFQLSFSAPLSVASGCIGLSQYATYLFPSLAKHTVTHTLRLGTYSAAVALGPVTLVAIATVALAVVLLYRNLAGVQRLSLAMGSVVMGTVAWILLTGVTHAHWRQAFSFPAHAFTLSPAFFTGLGAAMLIATYDYWGYYNITFLGAEVKDPARTIPRAILISIGCVAVIYLLMNVTVLAVLPWQSLLVAQNLDARRAIISLFMETAYGPQLGPMLGKVAAVLIMVTAFASVFSLLLGYSRIPYAAARDGNYFRAFGRLHPTKGFPHVSLLTLGTAAVVFCFFSLKDVIAALVVLRILLQFLLQHVGVIYLRRTQPGLLRPFRLWLYPLPPVLALLGFVYVLLARPGFERELLLAGGLILVGTVVYLLRGRFRLAN